MFVERLTGVPPRPCEKDEPQLTASTCNLKSEDQLNAATGAEKTAWTQK